MCSRELKLHTERSVQHQKAGNGPGDEATLPFLFDYTNVMHVHSPNTTVPVAVDTIMMRRLGGLSGCLVFGCRWTFESRVCPIKFDINYTQT